MGLGNCWLFPKKKVKGFCSPQQKPFEWLIRTLDVNPCPETHSRIEGYRETKPKDFRTLVRVVHSLQVEVPDFGLSQITVARKTHDVKTSKTCT
jgi:hypothetical protein